VAHHCLLAAALGRRLFTETTMSTLAIIGNRMTEDMRLMDFRPKTQDAYWRAARQFLQHVGKEPPDLTEEDVRSYLIHLRDERVLAPSTRHIAVHGPRIFFKYTCPQDWQILKARPRQRPRSAQLANLLHLEGGMSTTALDIQIQMRPT
jgi:hypothetical protein